MSTGAKLDTTAAGGIGGIKERLKSLQDNITRQNEQADNHIKEKDILHRNFCKTMGQQQQLKDKRSTREEELEKCEKKIKETEVRLRQKEEFLKELSKFNAKLTTSTPNESDRAKKEKELHDYKGVYHKAHEQYVHAKEQKCELEQRLEHVEIRSRAVQKKVDGLKQELENSLMEEGRRSEQCRQSMDAAFRIERNIIGVQKMLEGVEKRRAEAMKRSTELQKRVNSTDDDLETTSYDRRVVEATIREILIKSKEN